MSPLTLRRYRAERLLREDFERRRERVLAIVTSRLAVRGVALARPDLESCYAQAWHGLYATMLAGAEVDSPAAWLVLVTHRRALDEHRAATRRAVSVAKAAGEDTVEHRAGDDDEGDGGLAVALDRRLRLRAWMEGLRRLDGREREAAALCYLHGFTHAEAAARMGLGERRMRRLMEGRPGRAGVTARVGALADTIRAGAWCDEQASLMRALAYGLLEPDGERRRMAEMHSEACPACRAYVLSLRGLAAVLPPVFVPLMAGAGAGSGAGAGAGATGGSGGAASGAAGTGAVGTGAVGAGAKAGSVAAGAGGGWGALGAPVAIKLAAGCLLAVGVGAGCVAVTSGQARSHAHVARRAARSAPAVTRMDGGVRAGATAGAAAEVPPGSTRTRPATGAAVGASARVAAASEPSSGEREFTPEQGG